MKKYFFLTAVFALMTANSVSASFTDVPQTHVNYDAINYVQEQGIVSGYADGTYQPWQRINRAEFIKIIMEAKGFDTATGGANCFSDVGTDWFAPYACGAKTAGIISGYPDGSFKPAQNISFVEAAKIIANGLGMPTTADEAIWYKPFVDALAEKMAIPNTILSFDEEITRGEMAEMIYRIKAGRDDKISRNYKLIESGPFSADKTNVYLGDQKIEGADLATFEALEGTSYAKDKNNVYFGAEKIEEADLATFEVFKGTHFAKDKNNVYFCEEKIEEADSATFEVLDGGCCAKDRNNGYYMLYGDGPQSGGPFTIAGVDSATFESLGCQITDGVPISNGYTKDKNHVYFHSGIIVGADPATFELLGVVYAKDKNSVYSRGEIIEGADPVTFHVLPYVYAKDKNHVYLYTEIIEGADPVTFQSFPYCAKDKNNVYCRGEVMEGADPATFEVLEDTAYAKDKNHVYEYGIILEGVDPATFQP